MKKLMFMAVIAMVLTVFNACQKDELKTLPDEGISKTSKPDVYLENGYLAFKNMNAVDSVINVLGKMSRQEKDSWEQKIGLKSARSEFEKLFDEYEKLATKEEFLKFKDKYAERLKFNELDETDCSIDYPYSCTFFSSIMNNEGIFKVGLSLFKYTKENQIIVLDGDIKKLQNLSAYSGDKNIIINTNLKSTQSESDTMLDEFANYNPFGSPSRWWTSGDRRLLNELRWLKYMYVLTSSGSFSTVRYGFVFYLRQESQKHTWLGWNTFWTTYQFKNVQCKGGSLPTGIISYPNGGESEEVKPQCIWNIYRDETTTQIPTSSLDQIYNAITKPMFSLKADVSCRGFDGVLNDILHKEHAVFP